MISVVRASCRQAAVRCMLLMMALLIIGMIVAGCAKHPATLRNPGTSVGNPSHATKAPSNADNYLIENRYFALSYNSSKGTPNWVSWRLTKDDVGSAARVPFYPDTDLPAGFQVVTPGDYTGSGFDRGHMCPHGDRSADSNMSKATFVMTNIIPQSPPLNEQTWEQLESYCRDLAQQGSVLYIVDGPYGKGGTGKNGYAETIGATNTVTVPSKCWKVIMVLDSATGSDPSKLTRPPRLIAVIMPNNMRLSRNWAKYRTSVARVEKLTGYTFFDRVPAGVINPAKAIVDTVPIPPSAPRRYGRQL